MKVLVEQSFPSGLAGMLSSIKSVFTLPVGQRETDFSIEKAFEIMDKNLQGVLKPLIVF